MSKSKKTKTDKPAGTPAPQTGETKLSLTLQGKGVQGTILTCLKKGPISKADILKVLVRKFPERKAESMKATVGSQVPGGLKREQGIEVKKNKDGLYYVE